MASAAPRLRVFAGPNGSGKSTIKEALKPEWLGVYVNADELEKDIRRHGRVDLADFGLSNADLTGMHAFMVRSGGHPVPPEKISDYGDSLRLGDTAIRPWFEPVLSHYR